MNTLAKSARVNTALMVLEHTNNGMSITRACEEVGMPRSTYYYIVKNNPESFREVQKYVQSYQILQLLLILDKKLEILQKVIAAGLDDETPTAERLAICKELDRQMEMLKQTVHDEITPNWDYGDIVLTGPITSIQESRVISN